MNPTPPSHAGAVVWARAGRRGPPPLCPQEGRVDRCCVLSYSFPLCAVAWGSLHPQPPAGLPVQGPPELTVAGPPVEAPLCTVHPDGSVSFSDRLAAGLTLALRPVLAEAARQRPGVRFDVSAADPEHLAKRFYAIWHRRQPYADAGRQGVGFEQQGPEYRQALVDSFAELLAELA